MAPFVQPDEVMIVRYVQPLTQEQRQLLETTMKDDSAFRARSRAHGLLLSAHGTTIKDIAKTYQVHRVTVSAWIKNWEQHGAQTPPRHPLRQCIIKLTGYSRGKSPLLADALCCPTLGLDTTACSVLCLTRGIY